MLRASYKANRTNLSPSRFNFNVFSHHVSLSVLNTSNHLSLDAHAANNQLLSVLKSPDSRNSKDNILRNFAIASPWSIAWLVQLRLE